MTDRTMRAWHVTAHGEPEDVLRLVEVARPSAAAGDVLIEVAAVAANFPDVLLARGQYQVRPELPFIPGIELSGRIAALGDGVTGFAVGDRVVASKIGVLAEYAAVPARDVYPAPAGLDDLAAAGVIIATQTAWFGLHRRAGVKAGDRVLVHAAAGGVGVPAVQIAAAAGARVIAVVGDERKAAVAREAGAEHVLRRGSDDIPARVKELTDGRGVDIVFDPVGGEAFDASTRCIAFEGRLVVVGFASGVIPRAAANHALVKNYSIMGLHWALYTQKAPELVREAHAEIVRLIEAGSIRPVVDSVVPFDRAPDAIQALAAGGTVGRVVIQVAP